MTITPEQRNTQVKPPEGLGSMQRQFATAITTPFLFLTEEGDFGVQLEHYPPEIVAQMVEAHGLTGAERLAVYNQQYWFRLFTVMQEEYPTLVGLLGYLELNKLVSCYLQIWPSSSPFLRHLSDRLAEFLGLPDHPWNSELIKQAARLDYLYIQAFDAASHPPLNAASLIAVDPFDLKLKLQPHCFLYEEDWNLVACRFQLKQEGQTEVEPGPEKGWWMIYRDKKVRAERLGPLQFYLLGFLQKGLSLGDALEQLSEILDEQQLTFLTDNIQQWFTRWTKLNWLAAS